MVRNQSVLALKLNSRQRNPGTMLQRELFKILVKMQLSQEHQMENMHISSANYSTLQYHPFVKYFDIPTTGAPLIGELKSILEPNLQETLS